MVQMDRIISPAMFVLDVCVCVQFAVKMTSLMRHDDQAVILGWKPLARAARAVKPGGLLAPTLEGKLRACCFFCAQNMQTWDPVLVGVQLYICLNIFELILVLSKTTSFNLVQASIFRYFQSYSYCHNIPINLLQSH